MFSFEPIPNPLPAPVSTPTFDGAEAARTARSIVDLAPDRHPGSTGDGAVADLVRERFAAIEGGEVAVQSFDSSFDGDDVTLRNVILTLPGSSERTILVLAHRDSAEGPGAATSAAATATLLGLADDLGRSRRSKTIIFASTDGGSDGAEGARKLIEDLPDADLVDEAIVISQPGVPDPEAPFVIGSGTDPESPSAQLMQTARGIAAAAFGQRDPDPGPWVGLSRLAYPIGIGEQAAIRRDGTEAIAISAHGERQIPASEDEGDTVSSETLDAAGSTLIDLIVTLDEGPPPDPGPNGYIRIGDNLVPGWTLSLLAITLLIAPLLTAGDTWLRERRNDWRTRRTIVWAAERALLPLAALLLAYLLGLVGLIPDPAFPYDPGLHPPGSSGPIAFAALAAAVALAALLVRPMRTPLDVEPQTLAAAAGLLTGLAIFGIWLLNPYLALLLAPAAHVWLPAARASGPPRASALAIVALLSLIPALVAFATVAGQLDLGAAAPWQFLLLIEDGQVSLLTSLLWCALLGGLISCVAAAGAGARALPPLGPTGSIRGAGSHAGPGALGEPRRRAAPAADPAVLQTWLQAWFWTRFWTPRWTLVRSC